MLKLIALGRSGAAARSTQAFLKRAVLAYLSQELLPGDARRDDRRSAQLKTLRGRRDALHGRRRAGRAAICIRRGSVTVSRTHRRDGGRALLRRGRQLRRRDGAAVATAPRMATVRAAVATEAIVLDGARFKDVVGPQRRRCARSSRRRSSSASRANVQHGVEHRVRAASISFLLAAGHRRGDRRAADRREPVHPLRQLREGLRRHARRHVAARPRGRPDVRATSTCRPRAGTARTRTA